MKADTITYHLGDLGSSLTSISSCRTGPHDNVATFRMAVRIIRNNTNVKCLGHHLLHNQNTISAGIIIIIIIIIFPFQAKPTILPLPPSLGQALSENHTRNF